MNGQTIITILGFIGSSAFASLITHYFMKDKVKAETNKLNIEGDVNIGDSWKQYAQQMRKDLDGVKMELNAVHNKNLELEKKYNDVIAAHQELLVAYEQTQKENQILKATVANQQVQITDLQKQINGVK